MCKNLSITRERFFFSFLSLEKLGLAGVLESAFVVMESCGKERPQPLRQDHVHLVQGYLAHEKQTPAWTLQ